MHAILAFQDAIRTPSMILIGIFLLYVLYQWDKTGSDGMPGRG